MSVHLYFKYSLDKRLGGAHSESERFRVDKKWQYTYKRNIEARSRNHCCRVKAISITYFEYVAVA